MKKKKFLILAITFLASVTVVFLCIFITQTFLRGCLWWECVPTRHFHVHDWELPTNMFPDNALVGHIGNSSEGGGEIEHGTQTIFWPYGGAGYRIDRYATRQKSTLKYNFEVDHMVDFETNMPWTELPQIVFRSNHANDVHIACGNGLQGMECGFAGRYEEYVIYYSSSIDERMDFKNFEEILVYIDKQISSRLYP